MGDGLQGRSYFEDLDCLRTVLLVKVGGLRELRADDLMADGLVEAENRKVVITTGILEAVSTGVRTIPMVSNNVLPEILIPT